MEELPGHGGLSVSPPGLHCRLPARYDCLTSSRRTELPARSARRPSRAVLSHRARPCVGLRGRIPQWRTLAQRSSTLHHREAASRVPQTFHHHAHPDLLAGTRSFIRRYDMLVTSRRGRSGPAHSDRSRKPSAPGSRPRDVYRGFQDVNGGTPPPEGRFGGLAVHAVESPGLM